MPLKIKVEVLIRQIAGKLARRIAITFPKAIRWSKMKKLGLFDLDLE